MATSTNATRSVAENFVVIKAQDDKESQSNVPEAVFFEDVEKAVNEHGADNLIAQLTTLAQKYRYSEAKFAKSRENLEQKIPDVKRALKAVQSFERKCLKAADAGSSSIESHFELSDGLFARATIAPTSTVCLWLGSNVMVEYSFKEAVELLTNNLDAATRSLKSTEEDMAYVRDQINTTEVNMSRIYNYQIQLVRQKANAAGSASS